MKPHKKLSVLIVTYNSIDTINDCLDSIESQTLKDYEILIRDNASSDGTASLLKSRQGVVFFKENRNIGFGAAVNYLAQKARGEYLFILNPDCVCPPDLFESLDEFAGLHEGVISPALEYPGGEPQLSARELPTYSNIIFSRRSPLYYLGFTQAPRAGYIQCKKETKVPAVSATALYIRQGDYEKTGGFDERFFMYGEDLDLCKRLSAKNIDIWYLPQLKIKHILGASSKKLPLKTAYYHHLSIFRYFTKHHPHNYIMNAILMILLSGGLIFTALMNLSGLKRRK